MKLDDIQVVGGPLVLATAAEVEALASRLWITFPTGYREYVTQLGEGIFGGSFVRIYPPWRIERELSDWRRRIARYWFWDETRETLPKDRAAECVILDDTVHGDELVFHPSRPNRLFVLPRDGNRVHETGSDLLTAIDWICTSGELAEPFSERDFEPFDSRAATPGVNTPETPSDPSGESLDDIVELARAWAKRHKVRDVARKGLRRTTPKGGKADLMFEGILFEGRSALDVGYGIAWKIIEKESGRLIGVFRWGRGDGHEGSEYEPVKGS